MNENVGWKWAILMLTLVGLLDTSLPLSGYSSPLILEGLKAHGGDIFNHGPGGQHF